MRIIPVLDLKDGQVVRGRAGRRSEYRPLVSGLVSGCEPLAVAWACRRLLRQFEVYLADLDAIGGAAPAADLYKRLQHEGFRLWLDAGVRRREDARALAEAGVARVIVGLETVTGTEELGAIATELGDRLVFSLDLRNGEPIRGGTGWEGRDASEIVQEAIDRGVRSVIVLDLARVGLGEGTGTEPLLADWCARWPNVEWVAGGGIRGESDLQRLNDLGVDWVLMASALHDGTVDVSAWAAESHGR